MGCPGGPKAGAGAARWLEGLGPSAPSFAAIELQPSVSSPGPGPEAGQSQGQMHTDFGKSPAGGDSLSSSPQALTSVV